MTVAFKSVRSERVTAKLPDRWSSDRDRKLLAARGRYSALADLAAKWGIGTQVLLARWHKLRAQAGNAQDVKDGPVSYQTLVATSTPGVQATLRMLRLSPLSYDEIARQIGCTITTAKTKVTRARDHCAAKGWRIEERKTGPLERLHLEAGA